MTQPSNPGGGRGKPDDKPPPRPDHPPHPDHPPKPPKDREVG